MSEPLSIEEIRSAADRLGVSLAAMRAVLAVESRGRGFVHHRGRMVAVVLFEAHHFYKRSGRYPVSRDYPHLSSRTWNRALYNRAGRAVGPHEDRQRVKLEEAAGLDACYKTGTDELARAAHESCSWGLGQVMGFHWKALRYPSVWEFVAQMERGEAEQLDAMARYIERFDALGPLRQGGTTPASWRPFARAYNGPGYEQNRYHVLLATAFSRFS